MKPHLYVFTVPEPQPNVQQVEQVKILPAPGKISEHIANNMNNLLICRQIMLLFLSFNSVTCLSPDVVACACYANASEYKRK